MSGRVRYPGVDLGHQNVAPARPAGRSRESHSSSPSWHYPRGVGWLRPHCRGESRFQCPDHFRGKYPEPTPAPMLHHIIINIIAIMAMIASSPSSPSSPSWPSLPHRHHCHHGQDRLIAIMAMIASLPSWSIIASSPPWPSSPHHHRGHHRLIASIAIIARPVSRPVFGRKYRIYSTNAVPE